MSRIEGREGGVPLFSEVRDTLINEYGKEGATTREVLKKYAPKYRLRYHEVDLDRARDAVKKNRVVVAIFSLDDPQWDRFSSFFQQHPDGKLAKSVFGDVVERRIGHAVVLASYDALSLRFMNSWGLGWGDKGFFSIQSNPDLLKLMNFRFFDVYWTIPDLLEVEIKRFEEKSLSTAEGLLEQVPSDFFRLPYECPLCQNKSPCFKYTGNIRNSICPSCHKSFTPNGADLLKTLYLS